MLFSLLIQDHHRKMVIPDDFDMSCSERLAEVGEILAAGLELQNVQAFFARFLKDESGATAIECGLIAAGILPSSLWSTALGAT